jgi:hypothetical protein
MAKKAPKTAAIITIRGAGRMTKKGRRDIANWLRRHADSLVKYGHEYSNGRFIGRYHYA